MGISLVAECGEIFEIHNDSKCFEGFPFCEYIFETKNRGSQFFEDTLAEPKPICGAALLSIFRLAFTQRVLGISQ